MAAHLACVDLDTFFVSVERKLDPRLVGQPVIVGATGWQGVVTSASYEVRALGVRAGMPIAEARRLAPRAVYLAPRHGVYTDLAAQVREILLEGTDAVVTASIDEFFLDFQGTERLWRRHGDADDEATVERRVRELRAAIADRLGLPASAGIGSTRAIAKMASKVAKPHVDPCARGVRLVRAGQERAFVEPQSVRAYPGIGPVAGEALEAAGIRTLGALLSLPPGPLRMRFGGLAARVAEGITSAGGAGVGRDRPAFQEHDPVGLTVGSISNERTLWSPTGGEDPRTTRAYVEDQLRALVERVCWRARRRGAVARTITLKLRTVAPASRYFDTCTRSRSIAPTADERTVLEVTRGLLESAWMGAGTAPHTAPLPVRLLGVALSHLQPAPSQLPLPMPPLPRPRISAALDAVRDRFGFDAVRLGAVSSASRIG